MLAIAWIICGAIPQTYYVSSYVEIYLHANLYVHVYQAPVDDGHYDSLPFSLQQELEKWIVVN